MQNLHIETSTAATIKHLLPDLLAGKDAQSLDTTVDLNIMWLQSKLSSWQD